MVGVGDISVPRKRSRHTGYWSTRHVYLISGSYSGRLVQARDVSRMFWLASPAVAQKSRVVSQRAEVPVAVFL